MIYLFTPSYNIFKKQKNIVHVDYFAFYHPFCARLSCNSNPSEFQANVSSDSIFKIMINEKKTFRHGLIFLWIFEYIFSPFSCPTLMK